MVSILMGIIGILFPISAAFFILAFQAIDSGNKSGSTYYIIIAMIIWGAAIYVWRELKKAYEKEKREEIEKYVSQLTELHGIRTDIQDSFSKLTKEVCSLINEIRQDRNERKGKQ